MNNGETISSCRISDVDHDHPKGSWTMPITREVDCPKITITPPTNMLDWFFRIILKYSVFCILWIYPPPSNSGKSRFNGIPYTCNVILVTIASWIIARSKLARVRMASLLLFSGLAPLESDDKSWHLTSKPQQTSANRYVYIYIFSCDLVSGHSRQSKLTWWIPCHEHQPYASNYSFGTLLNHLISIRQKIIGSFF